MRQGIVECHHHLRHLTGRTGTPRSARALWPSLSLAAILSGTTFPSSAHMAPTGWAYPYQCCSDRDCQPVHGTEVTEGPDGYVIKGTGEVLPYSDPRLKDSPDGEFHLCAAPGKRSAAICLFVPPRSF